MIRVERAASAGTNGASHLAAKKIRAKSQATTLIELAKAVVNYFHTPDGDPFAAVSSGGHIETHALSSKGFRIFLKNLFFARTKAALGSKGLQDAIGYFESVALNDGPEIEVYTRVGRHGESFFLDLCNPQWSAVEITREGWFVNPRPPVRFRRSASMLALPDPVRGDKEAESNFRRTINFRDENELILIKMWILAGLRPNGPYPILSINGRHGSAKSSTSKAIRLFIDPNKALLRALPKDERDLFIAAENSFIQCMDNVSRVPEWLSDRLCGLSTGSGFATRELHSDAEEKIFNVCRPCILNGIEDLATREDLADRCIFLELPAIRERDRMLDETVMANLLKNRAGILGYFLDAMVGAMANFPSVRLERRPRMADFAQWSTAAEGPLGLDDGAFMAAYEANREQGNANTLEASPIASHLMRFIDGVSSGELLPRNQGLWRCPTWKGTSTQLHSEIEALATDGDKRERSWPKSPRALSQMLKRLLENLEKRGYYVHFDRNESQRWIEITKNSHTGKLEQ